MSSNPSCIIVHVNEHNYVVCTHKIIIAVLVVCTRPEYEYYFSSLLIFFECCIRVTALLGYTSILIISEKSLNI